MEGGLNVGTSLFSHLEVFHLSKFLNWQNNVPSTPGLFVRTDGFGSLTLVLVSVEQCLRGKNIVRAHTIPTDFVPAKPDLPVVEVLDPDRNKDRFLGPLVLPEVPGNDFLRASKPLTPTEPGIYLMSQNLGHEWRTEVVAVTVHRFFAPTPKDEVFALTLPGLEQVDLSKPLAGLVFTPALKPVRLLDLQQQPTE